MAVALGLLSFPYASIRTEAKCLPGSILIREYSPEATMPSLVSGCASMGMRRTDLYPDFWEGGRLGSKSGYWMLVADACLWPILYGS